MVLRVADGGARETLEMVGDRAAIETEAGLGHRPRGRLVVPAEVDSGIGHRVRERQNLRARVHLGRESRALEHRGRPQKPAVAHGVTAFRDAAGIDVRAALKAVLLGPEGVVDEAPGDRGARTVEARDENHPALDRRAERRVRPEVGIHQAADKSVPTRRQEHEFRIHRRRPRQVHRLDVLVAGHLDRDAEDRHEVLGAPLAEAEGKHGVGQADLEPPLPLDEKGPQRFPDRLVELVAGNFLRGRSADEAKVFLGDAARRHVVARDGDAFGNALGRQNDRAFGLGLARRRSAHRENRQTDGQADSLQSGLPPAGVRPTRQALQRRAAR